jgi:hypothetical protein
VGAESDVHGPNGKGNWSAGWLGESAGMKVWCLCGWGWQTSISASRYINHSPPSLSVLHSTPQLYLHNSQNDNWIPETSCTRQLAVEILSERYPTAVSSRSILYFFLFIARSTRNAVIH